MGSSPSIDGAASGDLDLNSAAAAERGAALLRESDRVAGETAETLDVGAEPVVATDEEVKLGNSDTSAEKVVPGEGTGPIVDTCPGSRDLVREQLEIEPSVTATLDGEKVGDLARDANDAEDVSVKGCSADREIDARDSDVKNEGTQTMDEDYSDKSEIVIEKHSVIETSTVERVVFEDQGVDETQEKACFDSYVGENQETEAPPCVDSVVVRGFEADPHAEEPGPGTSIDSDGDVFCETKDHVESAAMTVGSDGDQKPPVERQEQAREPRKRGRKPGPARLAAIQYVDRRPRYKLHTEGEKFGFSVSDLVWGKVKSHPWWPGQIFDPLVASEMAMKYQRKDGLLVAYFGDKTFAWCDEFQLKAFLPNFSEMVKQTNMDSFVNAVDCVLEEVSRRVELGMTCKCIAEETYADLKYQTVDNAGILEGTYCHTVDRSLTESYFEPDRLLGYIGLLAQFPCEGADSLELAIAKAQLKAFYQSKGYPKLPEFLVGGELVEDPIEISPSRAGRSGEGIAEESGPTLSDIISGKTKSRGKESSSGQGKHGMKVGRKRKRLSELMEEKSVDSFEIKSGRKASATPLSHSSDKKWDILDDDSDGSGRSKEKYLDALGDLEIKPIPPSLSRPLKVGERISRIARKLTGSPPILKLNGETVQEDVGKADNDEGESVDIDASFHTPVGTRRKKRIISKDYPSPSDMLSQLCLAARDPIKGYSFLTEIVSFFTDFRETIASRTSNNEKNVGQKVGKKQIQESTSSMSSPSDTSDSDYMKDSYWSDILFENKSQEALLPNGRKRKKDSQVQGKKKRRKKVKPAEKAMPSSSLGPLMDVVVKLEDGPTHPCERQGLTVDKPMLNSEANSDEECSPTALILSFNDSHSLPSEMDLVKIFGNYGPLMEAETEVMRKTNRAKVVFMKRADAEIAFSSAGKFSIFGPALVSYQLRYLPSKPKPSQNSKSETINEASLLEGANLEVQAQEVTVLSDDAKDPAEEVTTVSDYAPDAAADDQIPQ